MKESANFKILLEIFRKNSTPILRDFNELKNLQNSAKGTYEYANRTVQKASKKIMEQFLEARPSSSVEMPGFEGLSHNKNYIFRFNPLCGFKNFQRNLPYYAIGGTYYKLDKGSLIPLLCLIIAPSLGKMFYAEKGSGAWVEDFSANSKSGTYRLRVSGAGSIEEAIISGDNTGFAKSTLLTLGCPLLEMAHLASGNIDLIVADNNKSKYCQQIAELLFVEAGGKIIVKNNSSYYFTPTLEKYITEKINE